MDRQYVYCQHGEPCRKAQSDLSDIYENLYPKKKEKYFMKDGATIQVNKLPSPSESSTKLSESEKKMKQMKNKDIAKSVYLGSLPWRQAEWQLKGSVGLYHQTDLDTSPLFLLILKRGQPRHYRVVQKRKQIFVVENGASEPDEFKNLSDLVKFYIKKQY